MSNVCSAEQIAADESKRKTAQLKWANDIADVVIEAVLDDVALPFIEGDADGDEQLGTADLVGDYDPIIDVKTGSRLSETIKQAAETLRTPEKILRRLYTSALKQKWADHPKKVSSEPTGKPYGRFYLVNRHGVWVQQQVFAGLDGPSVWRRIAKTQIDLEAMSYDTTRHRNWQHRYRITNETGEFPVDIAHEHTGKDADSAIKILMRRGVRVVETREARRHLAKFLQIWPSKRIVRAPQTGWFEFHKRWVFVLPDETLGATDTVILDGATRLDGYGFHRAGTSEEWRQNVAIPLAGNSNVILAVGTMLAGPLLRFADEPGGGLHACGDSKIGKSLVGAVGQSLWGKPYFSGADTSDTFGFDWDSTSGRLEERAKLRNDVGLYLDEISVGPRKAIGIAIYKMAGGLGRGRMGQSEAAFRILIFSTGEKSIVEFLDDVSAGQTVRLTDIPFEVQLGSAFELYQPEAAARRFYPAVREYHGSIGYDWLQYLVNQTPEQFKPRLNELRGMFLAQSSVREIVARAHSQVRSVINRFALIAATLAMAIEAQILPWSQTDTDAAIITCMQRWLHQRGNLDEAGELLCEIERRRQGFAVTANDRLIRLEMVGGQIVAASPTDQRKLEAGEFDGYIKNGCVLLLPTAWDRLWTRTDVKAVKKNLKDRQLLMPGRNGEDTRGEKVPRAEGGTKLTRFYVLAPAFIESRVTAELT